MCTVVVISLRVILIIRLVSSSSGCFFGFSPTGRLTCRPQPEVGLSVQAVTPESCSLWAVGTTLTCETTHTHTHTQKTYKQQSRTLPDTTQLFTERPAS